MSEDAFERLEKLAASEKKRRVLTPEQEKARERNRRWREKNPEKAIARSSKWVAENPEMAKDAARKWAENNKDRMREIYRRKNEKKTGDSELFAINQAEFCARTGKAPHEITANCPEPTRSKLQSMVCKIRQDPSAGKEVVTLLRNMREIRKLELAEMAQVTESETEN